MTTAETAGELRFAPPGPGFWEQDPVHFPRALTRYWTEVHPAPFARGTADFASFYGMLIGGLAMAYVNGIGYKTVLPAPEEEIPQRFQRAEEVFARQAVARAAARMGRDVQAGRDREAPRAPGGRRGRALATTSSSRTSLGAATTTRR